MIIVDYCALGAVLSFLWSWCMGVEVVTDYPLSLESPTGLLHVLLFHSGWIAYAVLLDMIVRLFDRSGYPTPRRIICWILIYRSRAFLYGLSPIACLQAGIALFALHACLLELQTSRYPSSVTDYQPQKHSIEALGAQRLSPFTFMYLGICLVDSNVLPAHYDILTAACVNAANALIQDPSTLVVRIWLSRALLCAWLYTYKVYTDIVPFYALPPLFKITPPEELLVVTHSPSISVEMPFIFVDPVPVPGYPLFEVQWSVARMFVEFSMPFFVTSLLIALIVCVCYMLCRFTVKWSWKACKIVGPPIYRVSVSAANACCWFAVACYRSAVVCCRSAVVPIVDCLLDVFVPLIMKFPELAVPLKKLGVRLQNIARNIRQTPLRICMLRLEKELCEAFENEGMVQPVNVMWEQSQSDVASNIAVPAVRNQAVLHRVRILSNWTIHMDDTIPIFLHCLAVHVRTFFHRGLFVSVVVVKAPVPNSDLVAFSVHFPYAMRLRMVNSPLPSPFTVLFAHLGSFVGSSEQVAKLMEHVLDGDERMQAGKDAMLAVTGVVTHKRKPIDLQSAFNKLRVLIEIMNMPAFVQDTSTATIEEIPSAFIEDEEEINGSLENVPYGARLRLVNSPRLSPFRVLFAYLGSVVGSSEHIAKLIEHVLNEDERMQGGKDAVLAVAGVVMNKRKAINLQPVFQRLRALIDIMNTPVFVESVVPGMEDDTSTATIEEISGPAFDQEDDILANAIADSENMATHIVSEAPSSVAPVSDLPDIWVEERAESPTKVALAEEPTSDDSEHAQSGDDADSPQDNGNGRPALILPSFMSWRDLPQIFGNTSGDMQLTTAPPPPPTLSVSGLREHVDSHPKPSITDRPKLNQDTQEETRGGTRKRRPATSIIQSHIASAQSARSANSPRSRSSVVSTQVEDSPTPATSSTAVIAMRGDASAEASSTSVHNNNVTGTVAEDFPSMATTSGPGSQSWADEVEEEIAGASLPPTSGPSTWTTSPWRNRHPRAGPSTTRDETPSPRRTNHSSFGASSSSRPDAKDWRERPSENRAGPSYSNRNSRDPRPSRDSYASSSSTSGVRGERGPYRSRYEFAQDASGHADRETLSPDVSLGDQERSAERFSSERAAHQSFRRNAKQHRYGPEDSWDLVEQRQQYEEQPLHQRDEQPQRQHEEQPRRQREGQPRRYPKRQPRRQHEEQGHQQ